MMMPAPARMRIVPFGGRATPRLDTSPATTIREIGGCLFTVSVWTPAQIDAMPRHERPRLAELIGDRYVDIQPLAARL